MGKPFLAGVALLGLATAMPAHAVDFSAAGQTATIVFDGRGGDNKVVVPGLSSTLNLTLSSISGTSYLFNYVLANTSTLDGTRVSGFGFDVSPNVTGVASTGIFDIAVLGGFTAGYTSETCFSSGNNNNCPQGQANVGVFNNGTGSGTLTLSFAAAPTKISLDNFLTRYQSFATTVGGERITSAVGLGIVAPPTYPPIPEPSTWATMMLGFGMMGYALRRQRQQADKDPALA
ncbi:cistern family PEP-CTERM protein [Novosphingobium piscinae]|uniref:Cistern family PEP-CTERM protein n=1 Tax=Novosphingobium piscinae TaxID=1507448 RepID=A0A7X1FZL5_9SPHN|nr:cistern family PEP-CTERM protein [Novosphingobium piscinae]MBC2669774.1 cistern family PEP-CTERM protein [Novosphingobium piscinae]